MVERQDPRRPDLTAADRRLVQRAVRLLRRRYDPRRHTVAAAVRTRSGATYEGVNLEGIHTPCAEPVAVGAALTAGDGAIEAMVAVCKVGRRFSIINPCGTCRQLLVDYAPSAYAIVVDPRGRASRLPAAVALPTAYRSSRR